jgi:septal ring factor EnvC (AmiA/AmiB activator)
MVHSITRFCIAVLIGVGATLACQLHGDEAKKFVGTWLPPLDGFLLISTSAQNTTLPQSAPVVQISAPAAAVTSSEMTQQLKTMASDLADAQRNLGQLPDITRNLADTRRSLEELAAKQEQIAQSIATLERFEQDVKQRLASAPQSRSVPLPPRKPTQQSAAQSSAVEASSVPAAVLSTQQRLPLR